MELRQVRAFVVLSAERHFGRAAARLNMTQPAVTQRVRALEKELGVELFTRSARGVGLTPSGEHFLPYAIRLVQLADQSVRDLRGAGGGAASLSLGYLASTEISAPAAIVQEFRRRHPEVELITSFGYSRLNRERVDKGELDLAFIAGKANLPASLAYRRVAFGELVLALPAGHPLAAEGVVEAPKLTNQSLILFPPHLNAAVLDGLRAWLNRHTAGSFSIFAHEPYEQAVELARASGAVALVPRQFASRSAIPGIVYRTLLPAPLFEVAAIYRRDDPSPAVGRMLEVIDEVAPVAALAAPPTGEQFA